LLPPSVEPVHSTAVQLPVTPGLQVAAEVDTTGIVTVMDCPLPVGRLMLSTVMTWPLTLTCPRLVVGIAPNV
jgi:hypothetical protein